MQCFKQKKYYKKIITEKEVDIDFAKCNVTAVATDYALTVTTHSVTKLFAAGANPNWIMFDTKGIELTELTLNIKAQHIGGGDTNSNHQLKVFYTDGTNAVVWSNSTSINSGSILCTVPKQAKTFTKFQYLATESYNTGKNVGCNATVEFVSAKEKKAVLVNCSKVEYDLVSETEKTMVDNNLTYSKILNYEKKVITKKTWTQPALTNNGVMGYNSFAVSSDALYYTGESQTYYGFDNNNSTVIASAFDITSFNVYIYNPVALAVSNISIICPGPYVYEDRFNKLTVYGSNDGQNYELIQMFQTEMKTNYSFNLSTDKKYKYYRLLFQNNGQYFRITEIKLTAQEIAEKWQKCTKEEYLLLEDNIRRIKRTNYMVRKD